VKKFGFTLQIFYKGTRKNYFVFILRSEILFFECEEKEFQRLSHHKTQYATYSSRLKFKSKLRYFDYKKGNDMLKDFWNL